jgi:hypothetical protein
MQIKLIRSQQDVPPTYYPNSDKTRLTAIFEGFQITDTGPDFVVLDYIGDKSKSASFTDERLFQFSDANIADLNLLVLSAENIGDELSSDVNVHVPNGDVLAITTNQVIIRAQQVDATIDLTSRASSANEAPELAAARIAAAHAVAIGRGFSGIYSAIRRVAKQNAGE